jgi:hypothetical protein
VLTAIAEPGFMLLDEELQPLAFNLQAIQILAFPTAPDKIKQTAVFLRDKIRFGLLNRQNDGNRDFVKEYRAGRRRYMCRVFHLDCAGETKQRIAFALLLERHAVGSVALGELSQQFALTERERETVSLLVEGLTSKEIANRMNISPNTVKAFLRLVMVKMERL